MSPADRNTALVYKTIAFIPSKRGSEVVAAVENLETGGFNPPWDLFQGGEGEYRR